MSVKAPFSTGPADAAEHPGRWWRRRLVPVVALAVLVSLGHLGAGFAVHQAADRVRHVAAGGAEGEQRRAEAARNEAVGALLGRMNAAFAAKDPKAFLSVVDPGDTALRDRQERLFRALGRLPLTEVSYQWPDGASSRPAGLAERYAADDAVVATVHRRSLLRGWDRAAAAEVVALTFARRGDRWTLVGDGGGENDVAVSKDAVPEPWSVGDVTVLTRPHVLLVGDRPLEDGDARRLRQLADRVEDAVGGVRELWPDRRWDGRVVVYALTDPGFVDPWFGDRAADGRRDTPGQTAEFDAEVVPLTAVDAQGRPAKGAEAGMRLVVSPAVLEYPAAQARAVVRHELTHLATIGADAQAPAWLAEGIAEYTAYREVRRSGSVDAVAALDRRGLTAPMWSALRKSSWKPALVTELDAFYDGTSVEVSTRYTEGWLAALYIADEHGEDTLREFVAAASDPEQPTPEAREKAALADVLHTDRAEFVDDVSAWARQLRTKFV